MEKKKEKDVPKPIQDLKQQIENKKKYLSVNDVKFCLNCGSQRTLISFPADNFFMTCSNCKHEFRAERRL